MSYNESQNNTKQQQLNSKGPVKDIYKETTLYFIHMYFNIFHFDNKKPLTLPY